MVNRFSAAEVRFEPWGFLVGFFFFRDFDEGHKIGSLNWKSI